MEQGSGRTGSLFCNTKLSFYRWHLKTIYFILCWITVTLNAEEGLRDSLCLISAMCGECEVRLQAASLKHRVKSLWLGFSCPPNSAPATCTLLWGKEVFRRVVRELCVRELCWPWWQRTGVLQHQLAVHTFWCTLWVRVEEQDLYKAVHQWIDCWMQQQATRAVRLRVRQTQKMALYICQ